jgi:7-cyano-7-deazaguanosine (preQ0) biosynthesis protein QueE
MLLVNEIFGPTIQGEGKTAGKVVMFLRLAGCNLACIWCDTPYTWNWVGTKFQHPEKYRKEKEVHKMTVDEVIRKVEKRNCKALVISGGEPMLQMRELVVLSERLKKQGWWIEIETNGTVVPSDSFLEVVDQINCSPKLSNSGPDNPLRKRIIPQALTKLASCPKTIFKFVVSCSSDIPEILDLVNRFQMKQVYLMPEGKTRREQLERQEEVKQLCKQFGFYFSPRLQVLQWDQKRGV